MAKKKRTQIENLDDLGNSWRVEKIEENEDKNKRKTGVSCPHCGGEVIEKSYIPFIGNSGVYGLGGRNQATENDRQVDSYYCGICQTKFEGLPHKDLLKKKSES